MKRFFFSSIGLLFIFVSSQANTNSNPVKTSASHDSDLKELFFARNKGKIKSPSRNKEYYPKAGIREEYDSKGKVINTYRFENEYDSYGHITQIRKYKPDGIDSELLETINCGYHLLPNGLFILNKKETNSEKYYVDYNEDGIRLREIKEVYKNGNWSVNQRITEFNDQGIRTNIINDINTFEIFEFDHYGRVKSLVLKDIYDEPYYSINYEWDDNNNLIKFWEENIISKEIRTVFNIDFIYGFKYFDPFSLYPLDKIKDKSYLEEDKRKVSSIFYNADVIEFDNSPGQYITISDNEFAEIVSTYKINGNIIKESFLTFNDNFGSYYLLEMVHNDLPTTTIYSVSFNNYGDITEKFSHNVKKITGVEQLKEEKYKREYDSEGHIISYILYDRTQKNLDLEIINSKETYTDWTTLDLTSSKDSKQELNVIWHSNNNFSITNFTGNLTITNLLGRLVYHNNNPQEVENIDISNWNKGIYIIKAGNNSYKIVKK